MKAENVKVGMKVVPFRKTRVSNLDKSCHWNKHGGKKQGYLFVTSCRVGCDIDDFGLASDKGDRTGDIFNASDFEPYVEKTSKQPKQKFSGYIQGNHTMCHIGADFGEADRDPRDTMSAVKGVAIAFLRAQGEDIKDIDIVINPQQNPEFAQHEVVIDGVKYVKEESK